MSFDLLDMFIIVSYILEIKLIDNKKTYSNDKDINSYLPFVKIVYMNDIYSFSNIINEYNYMTDFIIYILNDIMKYLDDNKIYANVRNDGKTNHFIEKYITSYINLLDRIGNVALMSIVTLKKYNNNDIIINILKNIGINIDFNDDVIIDNKMNEYYEYINTFINENIKKLLESNNDKNYENYKFKNINKCTFDTYRKNYVMIEDINKYKKIYYYFDKCKNVILNNEELNSRYNTDNININNICLYDIYKYKNKYYKQKIQDETFHYPFKFFKFISFNNLKNNTYTIINNKIYLNPDSIFYYSEPTIKNMLVRLFYTNDMDTVCKQLLILTNIMPMNILYYYINVYINANKINKINKFINPTMII